MNSRRGRTDLISNEVQSAARSSDTLSFILLKLQSHSAVDTGIILAAVQCECSADLLVFLSSF